MPDFTVERADEHDRASEVVMETNEPVRNSESVIVILRRAEEQETAKPVRPVQTNRGPEFMSIDGTVVEREELLPINPDGILITRWATEDLWEGPLDSGLR